MISSSKTRIRRTKHDDSTPDALTQKKKEGKEKKAPVFPKQPWQ
jgi:hypothetical protein